MALAPTREFSFTTADLAEVSAAVAEVVASGQGWVNLTPDVEPGTEAPRRNLFAAIFSSRGPVLPLATISPTGAPDCRLALGLQHAGGPKAINTLATAGHPTVDGWRTVSDHPRRGLVVSAPTTTDPGVAVRWLVEAAVLLTQVELDEGWTARVYRG